MDNLFEQIKVVQESYIDFANGITAHVRKRIAHMVADLDFSKVAPSISTDDTANIKELIIDKIIGGII